MFVADKDLNIYLSGGDKNSSPADSFGGAISSTKLNAARYNPLFSTVNSEQVDTGLIDYCCLYIKNDSPNDPAINVKVFIDYYDKAPLLLGVEPNIGQAQTTANANTSPVGVNFVMPRTEGSALELGTLNPGEYKGIWIRRNVLPHTFKSKTKSSITICVS